MGVILVQILLSRDLNLCRRLLDLQLAFKSSLLRSQSLILVNLVHQSRVHFYGLVTVSEKVLLSVHPRISFLKQILRLGRVLVDERECLLAVESLLHKLQLTLSLFQIRRHDQWIIIANRDVMV